MKAREDWRNDPERRAGAAEAHARWVAAVEELRPHVRAAHGALRDCTDEDGPAGLIRYKVGNLLVALDQIAVCPADDTLIGNMAAFGRPASGQVSR